MKPLRSGVNSDQRALIRRKLKAVVDRLASQTGLRHEAIVLEIRYFHQSASYPYRTTASVQDKKRSFNENGRRCCRCRGPLQFRGLIAEGHKHAEDAVFHHLNRTCADQHGPKNLKPYCGTCHDETHDAVKGSIGKGSAKHGRRSP